MGRDKFIFIIFLLCINYYNCQDAGVFPRILSRVDRIGPPNTLNTCEDLVKVSDEKALSNCTFSSPVFYPVLIENFDNKKDLLENFEFSFPYSDFDGATFINNPGDDESTNPCGISYFGIAYNNNIDVTNGKAFLKVKKEQISVQNINGCGTSNLYEFTASLLHTLPRFKTGIFVAKIKLPENPNFWPALWLFGSAPQGQEIDIFEHNDNNIAGTYCDQYSQMKMTNHRYRGPIINNSHKYHCYRSAKFPVSNSFFNNEHIYQLTWTDYRVLIYLDFQLVGYASRYYDNPFDNNITGCQWKPVNNQIPNYNYDCVGLNNLPNSTAFGNNKVRKDGSFPTGDQPMNLILNNRVYYPNSNYSNFSDTDMEIQVNYIYVWQQIDCNVDKNICNLNTFFNLAGGTNYVTGRTITVSDPSSCNGFSSNVVPNLVGSNPQFTNWRPHINMLARDEISILSDAEFEEGTYFRADIVDCNSSNTFLLSQKTASDSLNELKYIPEPEDVNLLKDSEISLSNNSLKDKSIRIEAIKLFPNPASKILFIDMAEEDFYNLSKIEINNVLGQAYSTETATKLSIEKLDPGVYFISFYFANGNSTTKKFVKE